MEWIIALLTLLTVGGACWAALETRRATQASLASQLITEFASEPMHKAMRDLARWRKQNPTNFADTYATLQNQRGDELDEERRLVVYYAHKIRHLRKEGLLGRAPIHDVLGASFAEFLRDILQPLQRAHDERVVEPAQTHDSDTFEWFMKEYNLPPALPAGKQQSLPQPDPTQGMKTLKSADDKEPDAV